MDSAHAPPEQMGAELGSKSFRTGRSLPESLKFVDLPEGCVWPESPFNFSEQAEWQQGNSAFRGVDLPAGIPIATGTPVAPGLLPSERQLQAHRTAQLNSPTTPSDAATSNWRTQRCPLPPQRRRNKLGQTDDISPCSGLLTPCDAWPSPGSTPQATPQGPKSFSFFMPSNEETDRSPSPSGAFSTIMETLHEVPTTDSLPTVQEHDVSRLSAESDLSRLSLEGHASLELPTSDDDGPLRPGSRDSFHSAQEADGPSR